MVLWVCSVVGLARRRPIAHTGMGRRYFIFIFYFVQGCYYNNISFLYVLLLPREGYVKAVSDAVEVPVVFGIGYLDLLAAVYPGT